MISSRITKNCYRGGIQQRSERLTRLALPLSSLASASSSSISCVDHTSRRTTNGKRWHTCKHQRGSSKFRWNESNIFSIDESLLFNPTQKQQQRFQSTSVASTAKTDTTNTPTGATNTTDRNGSPILPTKHSRKLPPPVCRGDSKLLKDLGDELLLAPIGSLYSYTSIKEAETKQDTSASAWDLADGTIQQAEYVIRGHASWIPNSQYHDPKQDVSASSSSLSSSLEHVKQIQAIMTRLEKEGEMYMELRSERLLQRDRELQLLQQEEDDEAEPTIDEEELQLKKEQYRTKFAPPGPTVAMYDALLDAMVTIAESYDKDTANNSSSLPWSSEDLSDLLGKVIAAHELDGGDRVNINPYTTPTMQSYNAVLRGIASLPYTNIGDESDEQAMKRDEAIFHSFGVYNTLCHLATKRLQPNAATFRYMLQIVTKYFPSSQVRSNIAVTLWMHASQAGVVDQNVQEELRRATTRTDDHENEKSKAAMAAFLGPRLVPWIDLPQRWKANSRKRRHDPSNALY